MLGRMPLGVWLAVFRWRKAAHGMPDAPVCLIFYYEKLVVKFIVLPASRMVSTLPVVQILVNVLKGNLVEEKRMESQL